MIRPVGVGLMSRGPIGVEGLTITAGRPSLGDHPLHQPLGGDLAVLVGPDGLAVGASGAVSSDGAPSSRKPRVATLQV